MKPSPDPQFSDLSVKNFESKSEEGGLLGLLVAGFYGLFTLLPDSNSLMVAWPWVFLWQVGLACSSLWLLWRLWCNREVQGLGNGLDWVTGLTVIGLIVSTSFAEFPNQARWYSWSVLGFLAALYALNDWLTTPERRYRLLLGQGYLNLTFIVLSLSLWTSQTLLPELARLRQLRQERLDLTFDFSVLELRNWAPIGHQNYVAGYLMLALPLLIGLSILQTGWRRWLWISGLGLGLVDLYTTSSRGGWLGLVVLGMAAFSVLLLRGSLPRYWRQLGGAGILVILIGLMLASNRLRSTFITLSNSLINPALNDQAEGELAYRTITAATGWSMGSQHPWSGMGPGSVPLLYQQYRPAWAGREAELAYQLHSTPAQVWAELGVWGIVPLLALIGLLIYLRWKVLRIISRQPNILPSSDKVLNGSLYSGLLAYGVISLTDYQLDNICISGTLVIFLAVLLSTFRQVFSTLERPKRFEGKGVRGLGWVGLGLLLAATLWIAPIHWAWHLSSQGFIALNRQDIKLFTQRLSQAHKLAPWEPYYPYQLGWNLANLGLKATNPQQRQELIENGIIGFKQGILASPYQEFGHSNLGWLLLGSDPQAATQAFARSAQLMAAKRGVFYGLGLSLLVQGQMDLAVEAMTLESLRDPLWITSPIWKVPQLQPIYTRMLSKMAFRYHELLQKYPDPGAFNTYLHQSQGGMHWWQGELGVAHSDLESYGTEISKFILRLSEHQPIPTHEISLNSSAASLMLDAWLNPAQRPNLLRQSWLTATQTLPSPEMMQQLLTGMAKSATFDQWLKQNAPVQQYRRQRAGFGVLNRHIDGPAPIDFLRVADNVAMTSFFSELLPSPFYNPTLDRALQEWRESLLKRVLRS